MSWDIYGHELRRGYCEVHPSVHESYPCSVCQEETYAYRAAEEDYYASMDSPCECEECYYATGAQQDCDGTCQTLPYPEWDYFKAHPDQTPPDLLPTMTANEARS